MVDRPLLKVREVAELLGVSRQHAYRLIDRGVLPAVRVGGAVRIPRSAFEAWLAIQSERAVESMRCNATRDA